MLHFCEEWGFVRDICIITNTAPDDWIILRLDTMVCLAFELLLTTSSSLNNEESQAKTTLRLLALLKVFCFVHRLINEFMPMILLLTYDLIQFVYEGRF